MEPFTYCAHRWVMHGLAKFLHESHHRNAARAVPALLEANDFFPVILAAGVNILLALGFNQPLLGALVPTCVGITAYGFAYFIVHDVYIHRRLRLFGNKKLLCSNVLLLPIAVTTNSIASPMACCCRLPVSERVDQSRPMFRQNRKARSAQRVLLHTTARCGCARPLLDAEVPA